VSPDIASQFLVQIISTKDIIRSKNLKSKLVDFGLKFQISPGLVPDEADFHAGLLHSTFLSSLICQRSLSVGEIGCALAHKNALNDLLISDYKFGFIFEDDAEIISEFKLEEVVKLLNSNLPTIIMLGWIPGHAIAKGLHVPLNEEMIELITSPTCGFAYAINRPAAKVIIGTNKKIIDLADWPIYTLNRIHYFAPQSPWVTANQDPQFSIIGQRSTSFPKSRVTVFLGRIRLIGSLVTLMLLSKTKKLDVSLRQIVHRLLIRDMLYKYGKSQVKIDAKDNRAIPLSLKFQKLLKLINLYE